jgi:hypothetical protein
MVLFDNAKNRRQAETCPLPGSLVVKNGSKIRGSTSAGMPQPVSLTDRQPYCPGAASGYICASVSFTAIFDVSMINWPPSGMASRALTARFIST